MFETILSDTLSSLTAELSEISRARQLEQLGGGGVPGQGEGGVRVEGGAQLRRVETTSDSVLRLNTVAAARGE